MNQRLAKLISSIGSPVLLFPVIASYLTISEVGVEKAKPAIIAICIVFAVLSLFILIRKLSGKITNLDVSDQKQRTRNVYLPALGLVGAAALYFYFSGQPFVWQTMFVGLLLLTCFAINSVRKISLHTVVATYLSGLLLPASFWISALFYGFAALIAWSRVVLGRHTREEVLLGWLVGSGFGLVHAWLF